MGGAAFGQFVIGPLHQDPPGSRILFQTLARPAYSAWTKAEIAHALTCRRFAEYGRWSEYILKHTRYLDGVPKPRQAVCP